MNEYSMLDESCAVFSGWPGAHVASTRRPACLSADDRSVKSLRTVLERIGYSPAFVVGMEQVHGARIAVVREGGDRVVPACDGLVTDIPGAALCIRSADCLPMTAYDPARQVIGAVHAGWRGLRAGIAGRLIGALQEAFGSDPTRLQCGIGPGIGSCCYQVGAEFSGWAGTALQRRAEGLYLDLRALARAQLEGAGVLAPAIQVTPGCTACQPELFESFRRDGVFAGRMVMAILLGCQE